MKCLTTRLPDARPLTFIVCRPRSEFAGLGLPKRPDKTWGHTHSPAWEQCANNKLYFCNTYYYYTDLDTHGLPYSEKSELNEWQRPNSVRCNSNMSQQFTCLNFHQQPPQQNTSLHGLITCVIGHVIIVTIKQ